MTKHRSTKITEFLDAVIQTPAFLDEYFQKYNISLNLKESPAPLSAVTDYLDNLANTDLKDAIEEELARLYDIAKTMTGFIPDVIQKHHISTTGKENQHQLILHIFLHHKTAYNRLNDYYLLYGAANKMSCHKMECVSLVITDEKIEQFKEQVKKYFQDKQYGKDCIIRHYEDNNGLIIAVLRGKTKKSQLVLKDEGEKVNTETIFFRPAYEDILKYDKNKSSFLVHTSRSKDRDNYISAFADIILCDRSQAIRHDRDAIYTLEPIQKDDFSFPINETIKSVKLIAVTLAINGSTEPTIHIESSDIGRTFKNDLTGLSLKAGDLTSAKFLFTVAIEGKAKEVAFEITPPRSSDLGSKKYTGIIDDYLVENGIKQF